MDDETDYVHENYDQANEVFGAAIQLVRSWKSHKKNYWTQAEGRMCTLLENHPACQLSSKAK